jgi:flavin reductase (DIM6/NTAB) family NADH-FMN oxidoreductase RutF
MSTSCQTETAYVSSESFPPRRFVSKLSCPIVRTSSRLLGLSRLAGTRYTAITVCVKGNRRTMESLISTTSEPAGSSSSPDSMAADLPALPKIPSPSPSPGWSPGDKQLGPHHTSAFASFDPASLASSYFLLISGVVPRPIALVSSLSASGVGNLAPFSYFSAVSHDPPIVTIGICKNRDGSKKDTLRNIEETGEFVVNIISKWMVESANYTCRNVPFEVDELEAAGLTPIPSHNVKPVRVKESAFHMECKLLNTQEIINDAGVHTTTVVFGRVVKFHVIDSLVDESKGPKTPQVKIDGFEPVGRLGGDRWCEVDNVFYDIPRPPYP